MAINKNHEFEELDGIKCAIVERNISSDRVLFLKDLLVINGYTVVVIPAPPPKAAAKPAAKPEEGEPVKTEETTPAPELFTLGVTDLSFNPINAIFGRQLKTKNGCIVTQATWNEDTIRCDEETPYYSHTKLAT